jgi:hypothetical protein
MNPEPHGWTGALARRVACRDLNALLESLRQPPILESQSFHLADLDPSTLALAALLVIPALLYCAGTLPEWELRISLLPMLFAFWGQRASWLAVAIGGALVAQEASTRWLRSGWLKAVSVSILFGAITSLSLVWLSGSSARAWETELAYHCLRDNDGAACQRLMEVLPGPQREALVQRLQSTEKQIAAREKSPRRVH